MGAETTELLVQAGFPALFGLSFAAATLVPVGSEWLLAVLVLRGADPTAAVVTASAGNFLGACTTYAVGAVGVRWLGRRVGDVSPAARDQAERMFRRWGSWSLLLSWAPFVGDALCFVAGALRLHWVRFSVLVLAGKAARYAAVAVAVAR